jgi:hypothetical protein
MLGKIVRTRYLAAAVLETGHGLQVRLGRMTSASVRPPGARSGSPVVPPFRWDTTALEGNDYLLPRPRQLPLVCDIGHPPESQRSSGGETTQDPDHAPARGTTCEDAGEGTNAISIHGRTTDSMLAGSGWSLAEDHSISVRLPVKICYVRAATWRL